VYYKVPQTNLGTEEELWNALEERRLLLLATAPRLTRSTSARLAAEASLCVCVFALSYSNSYRSSSQLIGGANVREPTNRYTPSLEQYLAVPSFESFSLGGIIPFQTVRHLSQRRKQPAAST
jgi:hypothetical protein